MTLLRAPDKYFVVVQRQDEVMLVPYERVFHPGFLRFFCYRLICHGDKKVRRHSVVSNRSCGM